MGNTTKGMDQVIVNLNKAIFGRRYEAALALCKKYASLGKSTAQKSQGREKGGGQFWTNRTSMAVDSIFGYTIADSESVGWGLAHGMEYGKYLELARNRKHAVIEPTVKILFPWFMDDLRRIFK
jgi:hypothetical protein